MLLLCDLEVGNVIKEQTFDCRGSQSLELLTGAVQQYAVELADFRVIVDTRIHIVLPS